MASDPTLPETGMVRAARWLIWIYLLLWFIEGALRKWYLPGLSNPLLIVRDPVVVLIYACALVGRFFPFNAFVLATIVIGILSFLAGMVVTENLFLTAFGFRAHFLHLPLIFVMARVLRVADLRRLGLVFLIFAIPQVLIMAKQFRSGYNDWWNLGAGGGRQIISVDGKIRAAGTFSYITGPVIYFSFVAAFLLGAFTLRGWFRWWLLLPAGAATLLAASVAGSRSLLGTLLMVGAAFVFGAMLYPKSLKQVGKLMAGGLVAFLLIISLDVYREGRDVTTIRAVSATASEGGIFGVMHRALSPLIITPSLLMSLDPLGKGLGLGTNAGQKLVSEDDETFWGENEWPRVLVESGPILGLAFILMRTVFVVWAFWWSCKTARQGNLLPMALFGASAFTMLTGQFGQPTSMGGAVIGMGFWAAALKIRQEDTIFSSTNKPLPGRPHPPDGHITEIQPEPALAPWAREPVFRVAPKGHAALPKTTPAAVAVAETAPVVPGPDTPAFHPGAFRVGAAGRTVPTAADLAAPPETEAIAADEPPHEPAMKPGVFAVRPHPAEPRPQD